MSRSCTYHLVTERFVRFLTTMLTLVSMAILLLVGCMPTEGTLSSSEEDGIACNDENGELDEEEVEAPPLGPKSEKEVKAILAVLDEKTDGSVEAEERQLTDDEFFKLSEDFGFPIDNVEGHDSDSCEGSLALAMSSVCSIYYTDSDTAFDYVGYMPAFCYNYYQFPGDNEADCYIRFLNNWPADVYFFTKLNACAQAAAVYYGHQLATYDGLDYVYLRLDRRWCYYSNCEDGFKIF